MKLVFLLALLAPTLAFSQPTARVQGVGNTHNVAAPRDALYAYIRDEMAARHIPGLALAVVHEGSVVLARDYGDADLSHHVPVTDSTVFLIASITKTLTAVATLRLVDEGRVGLDDPIGQTVPDLPESWRPVTVRQLLQHVSGVPSFTDYDEPPCETPPPPDVRAYTVRDALAEVSCLPLGFPPGTEFSYSDTGYHLLGLLIEAVTGRPYEQALDDLLFRPLGIHSTRLLDPEAIIPHLARGYTWDGAGFLNGPELSGATEYASGGFVSTVHDMARWAAALGSPDVLRPETWATAWTSGPDPDTPYGMGFSLRPIAGHRQVGHTGGGPSAATVLALFPDDGLAVIVLSNANQPAFSMRELAGGIASFFLSP
jgi:CubicO group peptidase (beta-lactamase class C family)